MSTQQDIYAAGSESHPPMLNKENYVPWSSRLLRYAKSRPNGKLIHNSILNGPYVRKMIPEPGDVNRDITVTETFHCKQTMNSLIRNSSRLKLMIKLFRISFLERFTSNEGESIESYYHRFLKLMNDLKQNKYFPEKIASNLKFLNNLQPEWSRHVTIVHQTQDLHTDDYTQLFDFLKYNQKENARNPAGYNDVIGNQIGNGNLMAARAEGNAAGQNGNQIRCYNCMGEETGIQLQAEEYDLMAAAADLDEIEEVNANYILMANLQQASTSGTQTDSGPGRMPTKIELTLEQSQQGVSYDVLVSIEGVEE
nr:Gag-Pol polyprotein [Tanacetum cinerariifolium]